MSPIEWVDPDPPMTDAPLFPLEQGKTLGRFLDPVRAKALHEAVRYVNVNGVDAEDPIGEIIAIAERFESYLDPSEEEQPQP